MTRSSIAILLGCLPAAANPIVHDGSFGSPGSVNLSGGRYNILPQSGTAVGGNLFHSFSAFSVPANTTAFFSTNPGTIRIIARVTGGEVTRIDGTLTSGRSGTSLYLINPSGVIFGADAAIDLGGSFHAVAGDYLALEDGAILWADPSRSVSLSTSPVGAFGFLAASSSTGEVQVSALLESRANLVLAGRTVKLDGAELFANGDIQIAAAGYRAIEMPSDSLPPALEAASGNLDIRRSTLSSGGDGTRLTLRGGDMEIESSTLNFINETVPVPADLIVSASGSIDLSAGSVFASVSGTTAPQLGIQVTAAGKISITESAIQSFATAGAMAPSIQVTGSDLMIRGDGGNAVWGITSNTFGSGSGATIRVTMSGGIRIENAGLIASLSDASGAAGSIGIDTGTLDVQGMISNTAAPNDFLTGIAALNFDSGSGGAIRVNARDSIMLNQGGLIDSSSLGSGDGGTVDVTSPEIWVNRAGSEFFTGIGSDTMLSGGAGAVSVSTGLLMLLNGGLVSSSTAGSGDAGNIGVTAGRILATGAGDPSGYVFSEKSGISAGSRGSEESGPLGDGGVIQIISDRLELELGAAIQTRAGGTATAGDIFISGGDLRMNSVATMSVESVGGDAGSLRVHLRGSLIVENSTLVAQAGANGGNIEIVSNGIQRFSASGATASAQGLGGNISFAGAPHLILDHTPVSASAVNLDGGTITVSTGTFFANLSPLNVSSRLGAPGTVSIETLEALDGGEDERELELLDPADVLQPDCTKRAAATSSSFVRAGRGGTRRLPGGYLPSFRVIE